MIELEIVWLSGIVAGLFFILNFATCFSMPWATKCLKTHKCPGGKECKEPHKSLCAHHKPLAVLTILTGAFHIIVSVIWYFGL